MTMPERKNSKAKLSIILVTPNSYDTIQKVIACYKAQTVAKEIELVITVPISSEFHLHEEDMLSFHSYQVVEIERVRNLGVYKAAAIAKAKADVIVFGEDHSFPLKNWAEMLIERHKEDWVAVGPQIVNPNPEISLTVAASYMEYGPWLDNKSGGQVDFLAGHNSSFKKKFLLEYEDSLPHMLGSEYILFQDLRRKGHKLYFETGAVTRHLNFEKLIPYISVCIFAGRQFGGVRASSWKWPTKLIYFLGSPLIPFVRLIRIIKMMKRNNCPQIFSLSLIATLMINLTFDALGQMIGYAFGIGNATEKLFPYEFHRTIYIEDKENLDSLCA